MFFKRIKKIATLLTVFTLTLTGCSSDNETVDVETLPEDENILVTLVLDKGGVNDASFNQSAWSGAEQASKDFGIDVKYLESNIDADYYQNIETAIDMESDLIIGIGFNLSKAIEQAAISHPKQQFAIVDGSFSRTPSNVSPILFNEEEAGYLAGLAAGKTLQSDSNKFGFIGGFEIPAVVNYRDGFERGIKEANPDAILITQYANSFTDAAKGRVIAEQLINTEGVSCIVGASEGVNNGIYEVCKEKGKYAVAVDMAQSHIAPETILTSAIKRIDVGVAQTIKKYIDGDLQGGFNLNYHLMNDGVGYEKTKLLSEDAVSFVEAKKEALSK